MDHMRKIEVVEGRFILYNGTFFIKRCDHHIVWTSARCEAMIMSEAEANEILERNNKFLRANA